MAPAALSLAATGILAVGVAIVARRRAAAASAAAERELSAPPLGLRAGEPATAGLARMQREQIEIALSMLAAAQQARRRGADSAATQREHEHLVHETRKAIKRARTLLRLRRAELPGSARAAQAAALRDAGRALAGARDADVAIAALEELMRSHPRRIGASPGVARLHGALRQRRASAAGDERARALLLEAARGASMAPRTSAHADDADLIEPALERIYRRGRRGLRRTRRRADAATMHAWRKRVKDLRHAAQALSAAQARPKGRPDALQRIAREAHDLGEVLGQEHDLAMLAGLLEEHRDLFAGSRRDRKALAGRIERRRAQLRRSAIERGQRLYRRKPKRFLALARRRLRSHGQG